MKRNFIWIVALVFCFITTVVCGQEKKNVQKEEFQYHTGLSFGVSDKEKLPFWMLTNRIPDEDYGLWDFGLKKELNNNKKWDWDLGLDVAASYASGDTDVRFIDYYAGVKWGKVQLHVGAKADPIVYDGLSSTNGNFIMSNNARPYPRVIIESEYIDIPFTKGWFAFKGAFSEGKLIDDRYVDDTRIHFKKLYIKFGGDRKFNLIAGINHYAQWAGTSSNPDIGKLPSGSGAYKDIFFAKDDSEYDELGSELDHNRVGNHLGMFDLKASYDTDKAYYEAYRQVIFEDHSGQNFFNRDALMGLYIKRKKDNRPWVSSLLFEYYTTKHQSGDKAGAKPDGEGIYTGRDNYFNHSTYRSGWTNYGYTMGTPFFTPILDANGSSVGISNNRIEALHGGVSGNIMHKLPFKAMISYSQNYGTYAEEIDEDQVSGYFELLIPQSKLPVDISFGLAADEGSYLKDNIGGFVKISTQGMF